MKRPKVLKLGDHSQIKQLYYPVLFMELQNKVAERTCMNLNVLDVSQIVKVHRESQVSGVEGKSYEEEMGNNRRMLTTCDGKIEKKIRGQITNMKYFENAIWKPTVVERYIHTQTHTQMHTYRHTHTNTQRKRKRESLQG